MSLSAWLYYLWNLRFLPLRVRWPILKWRRRILHPQSPLELRYTHRLASKLRHPPQRPLFVIGRLLWPWPAWRFSALAPRMPSEVLERRDIIIQEADDLIHLRSMPLWRWRDSPQRSLYRMYEAAVVDCWPLLQYEVEYFWRHGDRRWATANLYDPARDYPEAIGPQGYAILAAIVEELVKSFQWRLSLGLRRQDPGSTTDPDTLPLIPETIPPWPGQVPALPRMLTLHSRENEELTESEFVKGNAFIRRNVFAFAGEFYTV
ncbi:hypothetical protein GGR56DRAFT_32842 [Xylariaceae sp. FL0804]|nr:hypothetical protein GGR56DRAFT_32842 [Xylariaceae sp. FL0804]